MLEFDDRYYFNARNSYVNIHHNLFLEGQLLVDEFVPVQYTQSPYKASIIGHPESYAFSRSTPATYFELFVIRNGK